MRENRSEYRKALGINFLQKISFYIVTLYYLKPSQIFYRILRIIQRKFFPVPAIFPAKIDYPNRDKVLKWVHCALYETKVDDEFTFSFLNLRKELDFPSDWNKKSTNKLWLYNLHYFDHLLSFDKPADIPSNFQFIDKWVV